MRGLIYVAVALVLGVAAAMLTPKSYAGGFGFAQQAQCVQQVQAVQQVYAVPQLQVQQVYVPQVQAVVVPQYQQQSVVVQKQQFAVQKQVVQKQRFARQGVLKQSSPQRQTVRQRIVTRTSRF